MSTTTIGTRTIELVPMTFSKVKKVIPMMKQMPLQKTLVDLLNLATDVIQLGVPDIPREFIEENITFHNYNGILNDILSASGFIKTGEPRPVTEELKSIGDQSTPS